MANKDGRTCRAAAMPMMCSPFPLLSEFLLTWNMTWSMSMSMSMREVVFAVRSKTKRSEIKRSTTRRWCPWCG